MAWIGVARMVRIRVVKGEAMVLDFILEGFGWYF